MCADLARAYRSPRHHPRPTTRSREHLDTWLASYREIYEHSLFSYLPDQEPREHLYDLVADYPLRGGKGLRPALCLAACAALGGNARDAVGPATTFELLHNAFLIHDDIEDESLLRRGSPTLHEQHGVPLAINAGDALTAISMRPILDAQGLLGGGLTLQLLGDLEHLLVETVEGQALDLGWRVDNEVEVTEADYLRMILKKTCWYTTVHPLRFGAMIAGWSPDEADTLLELGMSLGSLFQVKDDILNVAGEEVAYGKEIGGDILEGKRTLLLIHFLRTLDASERATVEVFMKMGRPDRDPNLADWIQTQMHARGSVDAAWRCARELRDRAESAAHKAFGSTRSSADREFLLSLPAELYESNR